MAEVANAGEHHGEAEAIGGGDDFLVAQGTARLNRSRDAVGGGLFKPVRKREEGI